MFGLRRRPPDAPERAHLLLLVDPGLGTFTVDVRSPFTDGEAASVLEAVLAAVRDHTVAARAERVSSWIRDIQRELGVLDKLRHKGRWEAEARNVVPGERFTGRAGRGLVEVTLDGNLAFTGLRVDPEASPQSVLALAQEAILEAEDQARTRWAGCLRGALEALPDDDKVELGLPRSGPPPPNEVDGEGDVPGDDTVPYGEER